MQSLLRHICGGLYCSVHTVLCVCVFLSLSLFGWRVAMSDVLGWSLGLCLFECIAPYRGSFLKYLRSREKLSAGFLGSKFQYGEPPLTRVMQSSISAWYGVWIALWDKLNLLKFGDTIALVLPNSPMYRRSKSWDKRLEGWLPSKLMTLTVNFFSPESLDY